MQFDVEVPTGRKVMIKSWKKKTHADHSRQAGLKSLNVREQVKWKKDETTVSVSDVRQIWPPLQLRI